MQSGTAVSAGNNMAANGQKLPLVDVGQAVERLNELMSGAQRSLRFKVDEGSGRTVITVINPHTHEVIRQIPSAELMAIAQSLEQLGSLIDARI
ncbi:MAG TPA: flagellar protein FlaG [Gammaproteobacteria bacterium]|nr:flagellar protein FlaG [Gammaproteobacteria bacterium]